MPLPIYQDWLFSCYPEEEASEDLTDRTSFAWQPVLRCLGKRIAEFMTNLSNIVSSKKAWAME